MKFAKRNLAVAGLGIAAMGALVFGGARLAIADSKGAPSVVTDENLCAPVTDELKEWYVEGQTIVLNQALQDRVVNQELALPAGAEFGWEGTMEVVVESFEHVDSLPAYCNESGSQLGDNELGYEIVTIRVKNIDAVPATLSDSGDSRFTASIFNLDNGELVGLALDGAAVSGSGHDAFLFDLEKTDEAVLKLVYAVYSREVVSDPLLTIGIDGTFGEKINVTRS
jgi:hypothetical protein